MVKNPDKYLERIQSLQHAIKQVVKLASSLEEDIEENDYDSHERVVSSNVHNYALNLKYATNKLNTMMKKTLDELPSGDYVDRVTNEN